MIVRKQWRGKIELVAGTGANGGRLGQHTPRRGGSSRGAEKPWGFFSEHGAPIPGVGAEKPGGFFSGGKWEVISQFGELVRASSTR